MTLYDALVITVFVKRDRERYRDVLRYKLSTPPKGLGWGEVTTFTY